MGKEIISTDKAPAAIGPYSQAVRCGNMVFVSGQIPIVPESGEIVEGSIQQQTQQSLTNVANILKAAGLSLDNVVKTTVFITEMSNFPLVNNIYESFFKNNPPARACVEVSRLPKDVLVEIEAIAMD